MKPTKNSHIIAIGSGLAVVLFLIAVLWCMGCKAEAQDYRPTCNAHPEFCRKRIDPLSATEKEEWKTATAYLDDLDKQYMAALEKRGAIGKKIISAHGMTKYPMVDLGGIGIMGGTCLGNIEVVDGFLVYTPSSDIESCEEEAKHKQ